MAVLEVFWFLGGVVLIALTGGSEGHVANKGDAGRAFIVCIWLFGLICGAFGIFHLLRPPPKTEPRRPPQAPTKSPGKPDAK